MCVWRAAPFLWQKDGFSSRDAHAFNRNSSIASNGVCWLNRFFHLLQSDFHCDFRHLIPVYRERRTP
jgi:hypothetical protein